MTQRRVVLVIVAACLVTLVVLTAGGWLHWTWVSPFVPPSPRTSVPAA